MSDATSKANLVLLVLLAGAVAWLAYDAAQDRARMQSAIDGQPQPIDAEAVESIQRSIATSSAKTAETIEALRLRLDAAETSSAKPLADIQRHIDELDKRIAKLEDDARQRQRADSKLKRDAWTEEDARAMLEQFARDNDLEVPIR